MDRQTLPIRHDQPQRDDQRLDDREEAVPPTPETLAKLRGDPLLRLWKRGQIDAETFEAAVSIRRAVEAIALPHRHRAMRAISGPNGAQFDPTRGPRVAPPEPWRAVDGRRRYADWVDVMQRDGLPVGPVLDVIVDGHSCRAVDGRRHRRKGRTLRDLLAGLALYVDLARHPRRRRDPAGRKT